jgi:limonene-1,2-epoxide hydrolase
MRRLMFVAVIASLAFTAPSALAASAPKPISSAAKLKVAREMIAAWHAKDWRKTADLFTEDGALKSMMAPAVVGREAIYKRFAELGGGIESITLDVSHMGVIDGQVYLERVDRFVYKGKSGAVPVVGVLSFKGDHIAEWREYYDRNQLLTEMGVAKPAP